MKLNSLKSCLSKDWVIASARQEASEIGAEIIKAGGNVIDVAVAVGFALGVCEPNASGLGGGGFMNIKLKSPNISTFIDFREVAPQKATPDMYQVVDGKVFGNEKSEGGKSICVPGEVAGLLYAHKKWGKLKLSTVMKPAIELANTGYIITEGFYQDLVQNRDKLFKYQETGNVYINDKQAGDKLCNPQLAQTLEKIMQKGRDGFYKGELAEQIVNSINKNGGVFTARDLEDFTVNECEPIVGTYKGFEIITSPLPSSGGTHIIQILNMLEKINLADYEVNSVEYIHVLSEVFKIAFADRQKYMGDPQFASIPVSGLISKQYAEVLMQKVEMSCSKSYTFGNPTDYESPDTTHYSIADCDGNLVSVTKTIGSFFGSGVVPENTGIVLNSQTRGFALGAGKTNSIAAGKKPLSSMSPTIVMKDGKPFAVLGSPGGNRIIPTVVQVIVKLIDYNMSMEEAINSPRVADSMSEKLLVEGRISNKTVTELASLGHITEATYLNYDRTFGGVQGIKFRDDGLLEGAADIRRDGVAIGQ